jgi:tight adherence protein C
MDSLPLLLVPLLVSGAGLFVVGFVFASQRRRTVRARVERFALEKAAPASASPRPRASSPRLREAMRALGSSLEASRRMGGGPGLQRRLARMGLTSRADVAAFLGIKLVSVAAVVVVTLSLLLTGRGKSLTNLLLIGLLVLLGWFLPELFVLVLGRARQRAIAKALPTALDLLALTLGAGLGFENAMALISERLTGPLGEELRRFQTDMGLGLSRRDALRAILDRTDVPDLKTLIQAMEDAEEFGTSLVPVAAAQSRSLRVLRRQRAQAAAQRAPIRMIIPMVLFILPVLMIVVLGPAGIRVATSLQRMHG